MTCIEVLSPSNKRRNTEGWNLYLRKRQALLSGSAHLVEIDLLRGGERFPMVTPWPDSPYYFLVCRKTRAPYCTVRPATYSHRLPVLSIPVEAPDPDLSLDLQPMIEAIYARSRYHRSIDYTQPLTPPLPRKESAWLKQPLSGTTSPKPARR